MRKTTALLIGWVFILVAECCFGQSYNASHAFRSRTIARPSSYRLAPYSYQYGHPSDFSNASATSYFDYRGTRSRSTGSYASDSYSGAVRDRAANRTTSQMYRGSGLDASRSLYRPGLGGR